LYIHPSGKTALIPGASLGIGATFVCTLVARGMYVILVARSQEKLHTLANEISGQFKEEGGDT
jgi:uncharacterized protein